MTRINSLKVRFLGDKALQRTAWKVADKLGWETTHDAEFVALTQLQADFFVTSDGELARAVRASSRRRRPTRSARPKNGGHGHGAAEQRRCGGACAASVGRSETVSCLSECALGEGEDLGRRHGEHKSRATAFVLKAAVTHLVLPLSVPLCLPCLC